MSGRQADYVAYVEGRLAWLRRLAYLLCQDWHSTDDLVQATVTRLFTHWPRALTISRYSPLPAAHSDFSCAQGTGQHVTVDGVAAVVYPATGPEQQLCIPDWRGLRVLVILTTRRNAPPPAPTGPHGVLAYARHLHSLGPDPAHWTTDPLR